MSAAARRSGPSPTMLLLGGLIAIGLALRLPSFNDSLFGDELSTNFVVHGFGFGDPISIVRGDQEGTPPLFFLLVWLTNGIHGPEGLRIVSLICGLAAIPLTYVLGVRTIGRPGAIVGAALVTLSPFQIFYATEARAYALMMLFCLLAAITLLIAIETGRSRWWVAYGLSVAAAAYTHYTSVFVLIGLFAWAFVARPTARRPLLLSNLGAAILYLPWVAELLADRNEPAAHIVDYLSPLTIDNAARDLIHWSIGHPYLPIADLPGDLAVWLMGVGVFLGVIGVLLRPWRGDRDWSWTPSAGLALVLVLALAAPVGAAVEHIFGPSIFSSRNIISSWPALALAAGALVTAGRAPWRFAAVALLLGGFAIGAVQMLDSENQRPDYAAVRDYIETTGPSNSPLVEAPSLTPGPQTHLEAAFAPNGEAAPSGRKLFALGRPTLERRLAVSDDQSVYPSLPIASGAQIAQEATRAAGSDPIFVVANGSSTLEQQRVVPGPLADFLAALPPSFHEVRSRSFPGGLLFGITVYVLKGA